MSSTPPGRPMSTLRAVWARSFTAHTRTSPCARTQRPSAGGGGRAGTKIEGVGRRWHRRRAGEAARPVGGAHNLQSRCGAVAAATDERASSAGRAAAPATSRHAAARAAGERILPAMRCPAAALRPTFTSPEAMNSPSGEKLAQSTFARCSSYTKPTLKSCGSTGRGHRRASSLRVAGRAGEGPAGGRRARGGRSTPSQGSGRAAGAAVAARRPRPPLPLANSPQRSGRRQPGRRRRR